MAGAQSCCRVRGRRDCAGYNICHQCDVRGPLPACMHDPAPLPQPSLLAALAALAESTLRLQSRRFPPVGKRTEQHACSLARTHHSYVREHATSSLPQGNLSVVYDQLGNKYDIPPYCLSEPVNLVKENGEAPQTSVPPTSATSAENKAEEGACDAPAAPPVGLKIKIRLSTQQELLWSGPPDTSVAVLKRFVQEQESIAPERQRFLFGGQLLQDSKTLAQAKVPSNCVVQVMVNPASDD